jgi:hypothetical protein
MNWIRQDVRRSDLTTLAGLAVGLVTPPIQKPDIGANATTKKIAKCTGQRLARRHQLGDLGLELFQIQELSPSSARGVATSVGGV